MLLLILVGSRSNDGLHEGAPGPFLLLTLDHGARLDLRHLNGIETVVVDGASFPLRRYSTVEFLKVLNHVLICQDAVVLG